MQGPIEYNYDDLISFSQRCFLPSLKTVVIGHAYHPSVEGPEIPESIARLLYAHPSIQRLRLKWNVRNRFRVEAFWNPDTFIYENPALAGLHGIFDHNKFLPNLQFLDAHPCAISNFAKDCPSFLKRLTELRCGTGSDRGDLKDIDDMMADLESMGGMPLLKKLVFTPERLLFHEASAFFGYMHKIASICSNIEQWEADLPPSMTAQLLIEKLPTFPRVREIHVTAGPEFEFTETCIRVGLALGAKNSTLAQFSSTIGEADDNGAPLIIAVRIYRNSDASIETTCSKVGFEEEEDGFDRYFGEL